MAETPTVYVICDANCKFEGMTKEQIYAAILQAVNEGTIGNIDTGFIQTIKTINGTPLKFFVGEQHEYDALTDEQKQNLFAIITNDTVQIGIQEATKLLNTECNDLKNNINALQQGLENGNVEVARSNHAVEAVRLKSGNVTFERKYVWNGKENISNTADLIVTSNLNSKLIIFEIEAYVSDALVGKFRTPPFNAKSVAIGDGTERDLYGYSFNVDGITGFLVSVNVNTIHIAPINSANSTAITYYLTAIYEET